MPHGPHNPPPKFLNLFEDAKIPIPPHYEGDRKEYVAAMRKLYAMGTWFDRGVAQLIEKLDAADELENTAQISRNALASGSCDDRSNRGLAPSG